MIKKDNIFFNTYFFCRILLKFYEKDEVLELGLYSIILARKGYMLVLDSVKIL